MNGMTKTRLGIPTQHEVLDAYGLDAICTRISGGESQRSIAKSLDVEAGHFVQWVAADIQRSAKVREARSNSAVLWDERAEEVLNDMAESPMGIAKARELAHHYRWRAKAHNPRDFGERAAAPDESKSAPAMLMTRVITKQ